MVKKIAMLGGTFDPIHMGHIALAKHFADLLSLDRVLLIPTRIPPHKENAALPGDIRMEMCRLAAIEDDRLQASDIELCRQGPSYSYDTVCRIKELYPKAEVYLITGADMFLGLETWYKYDLLKELVTFCAVPRDDISADDLSRKSKELEAGGARTVISDGMRMDISSTEIRRRIACGGDISGMMPDRVMWYTLAHRLYLPQEHRDRLSATEREQYIRYIEGKLIDGTEQGEARFKHSKNVAVRAVKLAKKYGCDLYKAELAGLLHDAMKRANMEEQIAAMRENGIEPDEALITARQVMHGHAAAAVAQTELYIEDEDILNALRYHTSGRAGMSLLEKIIYVADYTSAERKYDDVKEMRAQVDISLEHGALYALRFTVNKLRNKFIHPDTLSALEEMTAAVGE